MSFHPAIQLFAFTSPTHSSYLYALQEVFSLPQGHEESGKVTLLLQVAEQAMFPVPMFLFP